MVSVAFMISSFQVDSGSERKVYIFKPNVMASCEPQHAGFTSQHISSGAKPGLSPISTCTGLALPLRLLFRLTTPRRLAYLSLFRWNHCIRSLLKQFVNLRRKLFCGERFVYQMQLSLSQLLAGNDVVAVS